MSPCWVGVAPPVSSLVYLLRDFIPACLSACLRSGAVSVLRYAGFRTFCAVSGCLRDQKSRSRVYGGGVGWSCSRHRPLPPVCTRGSHAGPPDAVVRVWSCGSTSCLRSRGDTVDAWFGTLSSSWELVTIRGGSMRWNYVLGCASRGFPGHGTVTAVAGPRRSASHPGVAVVFRQGCRGG